MGTGTGREAEAGRRRTQGAQRADEEVPHQCEASARSQDEHKARRFSSRGMTGPSRWMDVEEVARGRWVSVRSVEAGGCSYTRRGMQVCSAVIAELVRVGGVGGDEERDEEGGKRNKMLYFG